MTSPVLIHNLNEIGYETHYMAPSMGSVYIFMMATVAGLLLIIILKMSDLARQRSREVPQTISYHQ